MLGHAFGLVLAFYLLLGPVTLLVACFLGPYLGKRPALVLGVIASAILAWGVVYRIGPAPELDDPAPCHDRQGGYAC